MRWTLFTLCRYRVVSISGDQLASLCGYIKVTSCVANDHVFLRAGFHLVGGFRLPRPLVFRVFGVACFFGAGGSGSHCYAGRGRVSAKRRDARDEDGEERELDEEDRHLTMAFGGRVRFFCVVELRWVVGDQFTRNLRRVFVVNDVRGSFRVPRRVFAGLAGRASSLGVKRLCIRRRGVKVCVRGGFLPFYPVTNDPFCFRVDLRLRVPTWNLGDHLLVVCGSRLVRGFLSLWVMEVVR